MTDHEAIVAGAGPAGLAAAAALTRRGVGVLVLERTEAVGACWRNRYDGLRLNSTRQFSGMPGLRIPRSAGRYPERDEFVRYLERYADHHGLDVRCGVAVERIDRDGDDHWSVQSSDRPMRARHVVVATGYEGVPWLPELPGIDEYEGRLIHAAHFKNAGAHAAQDVLIIGAGNTGVDLAGLLDRAGARVEVAMRTPPNLFPRDLYGFPLHVSAIPLERLPARIGDATGRVAQRLAFGDLSAYGVPFAPEGFQSKFRRQLIGPAIDDGFVAGLKAGRIRVVPTVERFEGGEVVLTGGERRSPDLVLCATGYRRGLEPLVGHLGVLEPEGLPTRHDGRPHPGVPGLYFAGFLGGSAGHLRHFPRHARRIGRSASRRR